MSTSASLFPDRFSMWVETELRRQGVPQSEEWRDRVLQHTTVDQPARQASPNSPTSPVFHGTALSLDMASQHVTDQVAVAIVEALLRLYSTVESTPLHVLSAADRTLRGDWSVSFRGNNLTDACCQHMALLVQSCQSLSRLDIRGNVFSAAAKSDMLGVMSGAPCDVILDNGPVALSTHSSSDSNKSPDGAARAPAAAKEKEEATTAASDEPKKPETAEKGEDGAKVSFSSAAAEAAPSSSARRGLAVSQSTRLDAEGKGEASSSVATSKLSYASGSAEALRRRREGLFGRSRGASPGATATAPEPVVAPSSSSTGRSAPVPSHTVPLSSSLRQTAEHEKEVSLSPVTSRDDRGGQSLRSQDDGAHTPRDDSHNNDEGVSRGYLFASTPPRQTTGRVPPTSSSPFHESDPSATPLGGAEGARAPPSQRANEPFYACSQDNVEDRNDRLDLTSNLSPILDSVLNLAGAVAKDGHTLRDPQLFGDAASVWDVVDAYEDAVEQSVLGGGSSGNGTFDPDASARLPASVLSGRTTPFTALTVLNLSQNNLTELRVFPATLLRLDVSSNRLAHISGLEQCKMLTVLNARRNQITAIAGLERNLCLAHVFLGHNEIGFVEGLAHLLLLETLDLSFNRLRTQGSLRALSLSSSLRHLLIRGNPVMEKMQHGFKPVLRNLCPSLLIVDDVKLSSSRVADRQQTYKSALRQSDSTAPAAASRGVGGRRAGSLAGDRRSGSATGASRSSAPYGDVPDESAMNLLHLLTRGVTAPTGYGDGTRVAQISKAMESRTAHEAEVQRKKKERAVTEGGTQLRTAMMKKLAEASKEYLEATLVERMTAVQQQQQQHKYASTAATAEAGSPGDASDEDAAPTADGPSHSPLPSQPKSAAQQPSVVAHDTSRRRLQSASRGRSGAYGRVVDPLEDSPLPDVMGYATLPPSVRAAPAAAGVPAPLHDGPQRRSSTRSASRDPRRPTMAPVKDQTGLDVVLAPYEPRQRASVSVHRDPQLSPRSNRSSRARAQSAAQRREAYHNLATADAMLPSQPQTEPNAQAATATAADVTLDAIYEYHSGDDNGDGYGSRSIQDPRAAAQTPPRGAAGSASTGYAALYTTAAQRRNHIAQTDITPPPPPAAAAHSYARPHQRYADPMNSEDIVDVDELGISPIPYRTAATTTVSSDARRRASPRLRPPPPMTTTTTSEPSSGYVATRSAHHATNSAYLVGTKKRIPREAVVVTGPARGGGTTSDGPEVLAPVRVDRAKAAQVLSWSSELKQDATAVQHTLKTMVSLLEAQRQSGMPVAEYSHELPRTYLEERQHSIKIIEDSGMLHDITVPAEVALYYGFSARELDGGAGSASSSRSFPRGSRSRGATRPHDRDRGAENALLQDWSLEESEREEVLRNIRVMGDAKTCLRYLMLLIGGGKERLLQEYVEQIKCIM